MTFIGKLNLTDPYSDKNIEVPTSAVREALINSFCHKDYNARQCNEVAIYKNWIEIYNPGAFPPGYVPENFIEEE